MLLFRIINMGENQWPNKSCPFVLNIIYSYISPCNKKKLFGWNLFIAQPYMLSPGGSTSIYTVQYTVGMRR